MNGESVLTVTELTRDIKSLLETRFSRVWVSGELFTFKRHSSGHLYFTLKDDRCQIAGVMFRNQASRLNFSPCEGMGVECWGRITLYEPQGKYQLMVESMRPSGEGNLLAALEDLKRRLAAEGLFDDAHKKPLPLLPRRVGLITSPTGAAIRDMLRVLHDRFPVPVLIHPAPVQGPGAVPALIEGIVALDQVPDVDVIIIGRGGGSLEDLWAFNDERLVRAIFAARTPVVSAVGHEVDFMLTDFVADRRAPTPTAAAEMVVPRWSDLIELLHASRQRLDRAVTRSLREARRDLELRALRIADPRRLLAERAMRLDDLSTRAEAAVRYRLLALTSRMQGARGRLIALHPQRRIEHDRRHLEALGKRLRQAVRTRLESTAARLERLEGRIRLLGPEESLRRGYAIVRRSGRDEVIRDASTLCPGDAIDVTLATGSAGARVETIGEDTRPPPPGLSRPPRKRRPTDEPEGAPVQGKLL